MDEKKMGRWVDDTLHGGWKYVFVCCSEVDVMYKQCIRASICAVIREQVEYPDSETPRYFIRFVGIKAGAVICRSSLDRLLSSSGQSSHCYYCRKRRL
jgi:hypothetical protein